MNRILLSSGLIYGIIISNNLGIINPVRAKMVYYVYVLRSTKDERFYTGFTVDLRKRLEEHNDGKYSSWTKGRGPFDLIYFEGCINKQDAKNREKYLKSGMGKRYLHNRLKRFLALTGCKKEE